MNIEVVIQSRAGSTLRLRYDEQNIVKKGESNTLLPHPWPYGFITATVGEDGDCLDCFVITGSPLEEGSTVHCVPFGVLEMFEGEELDHKVLAVLPGEELPDIDETRDVLDSFITGIFKAFPEVEVKVGSVLSVEEAEKFITASRS